MFIRLLSFQSEHSIHLVQDYLFLSNLPRKKQISKIECDLKWINYYTAWFDLGIDDMNKLMFIWSGKWREGAAQPGRKRHWYSFFCSQHFHLIFARSDCLFKKVNLIFALVQNILLHRFMWNCRGSRDYFSGSLTSFQNIIFNQIVE